MFRNVIWRTAIPLPIRRGEVRRHFNCSERGKDVHHHAVTKVSDVPIGKPRDRVAPPPEMRVTRRIRRQTLRCMMLDAVHLDDHAVGQAGEIDNVSLKGGLAAEMLTTLSELSKFEPKFAFCDRRLFS